MDADAAVEAAVPANPADQPLNNPTKLELGSHKAGSAPVTRTARQLRNSSTPPQAEPAPPGPALQQGEWPIGAEHQGRRADPKNFKPDGPCAICGDTCEFLPLCVADFGATGQVPVPVTDLLTSSSFPHQIAACAV